MSEPDFLLLFPLHRRTNASSQTPGVNQDPTATTRATDSFPPGDAVVSLAAGVPLVVVWEMFGFPTPRAPLSNP